MCGLAGILARGRDAAFWTEGLAAMARAIVHRGPDAGGFWHDAEAGVGLAHRRLSILDLSPEGAQPMASASGRYEIAYNGEIYNFPGLRAELESAGERFRGHSDTEVLLAAVEAWGLKRALRRSCGMFALALWDRHERTLTLARDRLGIKPLCYGRQGEATVFASELGAIRALSWFRGELDRDALALFTRHNYIPAPWTAYRSVRKLPAGHLLVLRPGEDALAATPRAWWSARAMVEQGRAGPFRGSEEEAAEALEALLREVVRGHMLSDVPLGAFLSGGIDSSAVVALMRQAGGGAVKTFSIGFREPGYDEAPFAGRVARHLGTDHTELYLEPREVIEAIPSVLALCDEPFADSSQIPTWFVSRLARRHVTVSLSGDGGDELFSGYVRYLQGEALWRRMRLLPRPLRRGLAGLLRALPGGALNRLGPRLRPVLPAMLRQEHLGDKLARVAEVLEERSAPDLYRGMVSHDRDPGLAVPGSREPATLLADPALWAAAPTFTEGMMLLDLLTYLPDDILVKVDRASMGVSLESRVPLLDHRVAEFAWTLPLAFKSRGGVGKRVLRRVLSRHVPPELFERPKMGFGIPVDAWLRGPLRAWADDLLSERRLREDGVLAPAHVRRKWDEHQSGRRNWSYHLWNYLVLQDWLARPRAREAGPA